MIKRTWGDGKPLPKPNTKVFIPDEADNAYPGQWVWVASYHESFPERQADGLVVKDRPGSLHGNFANTWEEDGKGKTTVIEGLSDKNKRRLAEEALEVSKSLGYCSEANKVIAGLGLPVKKTKTITLEVWDDDEVTVKVNGKKVKVDIK